MVVTDILEQGFRAPSLAQVGLGPSQSSEFFPDTYRCPVQDNSNPACNATDYNIRFSGNPDLKAEESESWNLGAIWQATDDLDLTLDVWSITQDNKIDELMLIDLYTAECNNQNSTICIRRAPLPGQTLGELDVINSTFFNVSSQEATGVDLSANYRIDLSNLGKLKFNLDYTYLMDFQKNDRDYTGEYRYPQHRWTGSADWTLNDWGASTVLTYIGEFEDYDGSQNFETNKSRMIKSQVLVDVQGYYNLNEQTKLTIGINNLFDDEPPFAIGDGDSDLYGYVSSMYNPRGQYIYGKVNYKF